MRQFPFYADRRQCKKCMWDDMKRSGTLRPGIVGQSLIYEIYVCWHIAGRIYDNIPATNHMVL